MLHILPPRQKKPSFAEQFLPVLIHGIEAAGKIKQMGMQATKEKEEKAAQLAGREAMEAQGFPKGFEFWPKAAQDAWSKQNMPEPKKEPTEKDIALTNLYKGRLGDIENRGKMFNRIFPEQEQQQEMQQPSSVFEAPGKTEKAPSEFDLSTGKNKPAKMKAPKATTGVEKLSNEELRTISPLKGSNDEQSNYWGTVAKEELDRREANKEAELKNKTELSKEVRQSFTDNKPYIDKTYDQYEDSLRKEAILDRMVALDESGETSENGAYNALEALGIRPEWLKNPANEEYQKLSLDMLGGGTLQADYGSRVLASEFGVSMQRIPTLNQTKEGRRQIAENLKAMTAPSRLKNERMQYYIDKAEREGKPLPHDLRGKVLSDIKPQLEKIYDDFKQRNGRYKVKPGTPVDENSMQKYYYLSGKNITKGKQMMKEDGYDIE